MTTRRMPLAGITDPANVAAVDQQHAIVGSNLTVLVGDARKHIVGRGYDPTDVGVWSRACMSGALEAVFDTAGEDADTETALAVAVMMLGEAVLRLARQEEAW